MCISNLKYYEFLSLYFDHFFYSGNLLLMEGITEENGLFSILKL